MLSGFVESRGRTNTMNNPILRMSNLRLRISNQAEVREGGALESLGKKRNLGCEAFQMRGAPALCVPG